MTSSSENPLIAILEIFNLFQRAFSKGAVGKLTKTLQYQLLPAHV
jgi:hypothetical protein